jgi:prevent-host-death family protein
MLCDPDAEGAPLVTAHFLPTMSYNMSYMGKVSVSVRELQQNLKRVMARVERGEVVEVTRRNRPVARLAPVRPSHPASEWPDLEARTKAVFGDRIVTPGGSDAVVEERGDW